MDGKKPMDTLLKQVKVEPYKVMSKIFDHFMHNIHLIDIKGIKYFNSIVANDCIVFNSLVNLLFFALRGSHFSLDKEETVEFNELIYLEEYLGGQMSEDAL